MVYEYRRMYDLLLMIDEYERRYDEHQGLIFGFSDNSHSFIKRTTSSNGRKKAAQLLGYEQAHLVNLIDPSIVGGVVIEANHQVIDGDIRKQLEHMQSRSY